MKGSALALRVPANFPIGLTYAKDGYYAVLTGPRSDMLDEIFPMLPDPSQDDDLKYLGGEPRERPSSAIGAGQAWRTGAPYYHPTTWSATLDEMKTDDPLNWRPSRIDNWRFGEYQTPGPPSAPSSRSDEWAEEIIVSKWTTLAGVTFTRRNLNWSYPDWDDFFIVGDRVRKHGGQQWGWGTRSAGGDTERRLYLDSQQLDAYGRRAFPLQSVRPVVSLYQAGLRRLDRLYGGCGLFGSRQGSEDVYRLGRRQCGVSMERYGGSGQPDHYLSFVRYGAEGRGVYFVPAFGVWPSGL